MMNDWINLADAARLGGWVVYPLTAFAIAAIAVTLDRAYVLWRFGRIPRWTAGDAASAVQAQSRLPERHALRRIGRLLADETAPLWRIEARVESVAAQIERDMSRGLWLLETIVTAAPLLGLLGTIVGMMHAFQMIGGEGLVNPQGVTGGVAQALIATAIGIVIALVALFAFNFFSRRIDRLMDELESLANEALNDLRLATAGTGPAS